LQTQPRMSQQGGAAQANGQTRMMGGASPAPAAGASAASTGAQKPK
jgi:hypothetical protein